MKKFTREIHNIIANGPSGLHDADGNTVNKKWVDRRSQCVMVDDGMIMHGFCLYDVNKSNLFIHMIWVDPRFRRHGHAKAMVGAVTALAKKKKLDVFCYANASGIDVFRGMGFHIGGIPYRECVLRYKK